MESFEKLRAIINEEFELDGETYNLVKDVAKVNKNGNKTAGIRIRKLMQLVKNTAQDIRNEISENRKKTK